MAVHETRGGVASAVGRHTRRWTRAEFERLSESGFFGPEERLELLDGEIFEKMTQHPPHSTGVGLVADALRAVVGQGYLVREQSPVALDAMSLPEPDIAVVRGARRDFARAHPAEVVLAVEVADSTVRFDRKKKGSLYARAGVREYWIVCPTEMLVEVYRDPTQNARAEHGWSYRTVRRCRSGDRIAPLAFPGSAVAVQDLLP